jgi:PKHD-type hydroxylase
LICNHQLAVRFCQGAPYYENIMKKESKKLELINSDTEEVIKSCDLETPDHMPNIVPGHTWSLNSALSERWAYYNDLFTNEECQRIISQGASSRFTLSIDQYNTEERQVEIEQFKQNKTNWFYNSVVDNHWIFRRCVDAVVNLNNQFFKYDITNIETMEFVSYNSTDLGFRERHMDLIYNNPNGVRKLSFQIQLSDDSDYKGGDSIIHLDHIGTKIPRTRGTLIIFPSWVLQEVTTVTSGTRHVLQGSLIGPAFK